MNSQWRGDEGLVSLSLRLKDLQGPVTRVKKKKDEVSGVGFHLGCDPLAIPDRRVAKLCFVFALFGFQVSGFWFRVSGSGSRVLGFGFRVSGSGFRVSGSGIRVSGFENRESHPAALLLQLTPRRLPVHRPDLGFRVHGFWFRVSGFGFRVPGFGFRVSGFGFWVSDFGFRVSD